MNLWPPGSEFWGPYSPVVQTDPRYVHTIYPNVPLDEWDEHEELGCVDLEEQLEAALDRAFPKAPP